MDERLPFYMVYQIPLPGDDERMLRRDYSYMKSAYPDTAKRLLPFIEEECDRLEYDGSMMFDEYPDKLQLRLMCRRIYDKAQKEEENKGGWLMDLIQKKILLIFGWIMVLKAGLRKKDSNMYAQPYADL